MGLLKKQDGFISVMSFGFFLTVCLAMFLILLSIFAVTFKRAAEVYGQVESAMDYAVFSANVNGATADETTLNLDKVYPYFVDAFCKMTNTAYANGQFTGGVFQAPVKVSDFYGINPGDSIPPPPTLPNVIHFTGATAMQPGYVAVMDVPVWGGGNMGLPPLNITMRAYCVSQAVPVSQ